MLQIAFITQWYARNYQVSCNFTLYDLKLAVFHRQKDRQFIYTLSIYVTTTTKVLLSRPQPQAAFRSELLLVPCNPVQPATWLGSRWLNQLPRQFLAGEEGGMTPCGMKINKTCQMTDKLKLSQQTSCKSWWGVATDQDASIALYG